MSDALHAHAVLNIRKEVLFDIKAERQRQIEAEGWTPEHDDEHDAGEMARAAAVYAYTSTLSEAQAAQWQERLMQPPPAVTVKGETLIAPGILRALWPWAPQWFKPKDRRHDLVRAAALIVAEIERLDRRAAIAAISPSPTGAESTEEETK